MQRLRHCELKREMGIEGENYSRERTEMTKTVEIFGDGSFGIAAGRSTAENGLEMGLKKDRMGWDEVYCGFYSVTWTVTIGFNNLLFYAR